MALLKTKFAAEKLWPKLLARSSRRRFLVALAMLPMLAAIPAAAYWLRFEGRLTSFELNDMSSVVPLVVSLKTLVFLWFGVYQGWSRYVTLHDCVTLAKATTASSVLLALIDYLVMPQLSIPRSVFMMDWGLTVVSIGGLRAVVRLFEESGSALLSANQKPVFIAGANDTGEALLRAIRRNTKLRYRVLGFITEDEASLQTTIGGVPVLGLLDQTSQLVQAHRAQEILITAGELSGQQIRQLVEDGRRCQVDVRVLPSYEQLLSGNLDHRPRNVSIEDLLCREPVKLNVGSLKDWIDHRTLLVTGSAGSIGSEICRQLLQFSPRKLVCVDQSETGQFFLQRELRALATDAQTEICIADVCDRTRMNHLLAEHRPDIIFHAAAYKHVPLMEENPSEAVRNITLASRLMADLAHEHHVQSFVMISTDKAVNPTSVMGTCKRVAELYVQSLAAQSDCRFVTVRFGNVLDSAGSVIPIFRDQIARGGPVTVTHQDMKRYFMTIPEASQLVIQAGAMGNGGEIFVLDMGEPVRIENLAKDMIRLSGLRVGEDIEIEYVGVRAGEKLYEELHKDGEERLATSHPKILVAKSTACGLPQLNAALERLARRLTAPGDVIQNELRQIVPEFHPPQHIQRAA